MLNFEKKKKKKNWNWKLNELKEPIEQIFNLKKMF